jgi:hypothetical protein
MKKLMLQGAVAALAGAAALALTATSASAYIACNGDGDCWHVQDHYNYDPGFGVTVHDDNWKWRDTDHFRWHEHEGRGYWRNGLWVTF